jgi:hypothetical protein
MEKEKTKDCCNQNKKGIKEGVFYGLIPHIGCIAFIIGSVLGVTILMNFFRPLLMNRYFFHWLFVIALGFATFSSVLYLRKNKMLSWDGVKHKKRYLFTMYGSTIGINLVLFMIIFPLLANVSLTGAVVFEGNPEDLESVKLSVNIPCPGHAPLISNELKTIGGVIDTRYGFPNNFDVQYDSSETNLEEILSLEVFEEYPARVLENSNSQNLETTGIISQSLINQQTQNSGGCCGCGGCR